MKNFLILASFTVGSVLLLALISTQGVKAQNQQQLQIVISPTVKQIKTQNQGEEQQLQNQFQFQENQENATGEGSQNRNQNAFQNMSEVAKQVQLLLQSRISGGIGDQIREIARVQNQAQSQIQEQINILDSKGKLARFLTGTDYRTVNNLRQEIVQNQLRIRQLEQIQTQLTNQGDLTVVQATIQALIQENTSLQERITVEEQTKSLFGWLVRLFNR